MKNIVQKIFKTEEIKNSIGELDSASIGIEKKTEDTVSEITNTKYSIIQFQN